MNKKCSYCGFINFATAEECKKCEAVLASFDGPQEPAQFDYSAEPPRGYVAQPYQTKRSFPVLKTFVFVFIGMVVLSTLAGWKRGFPFLGLGKVKWVEYHPESMDLTVMMPNEPTKIEPVTTPLPTGTMTNHSFISGVPGQGSAMFCFVDYTGTGTWLNPDTIARGLDAELNDFLRRTNSTLISKNQITYGGMPGLEFVTQPPAGAGATKAYGKMFMSQTRLYFFSIAASEGSELFAGKDKFLNPLMYNSSEPRATV
jgi:hypothetical protein